MDKRIKAAAAAWLPEDIHAIPLRVWNPDDNQVVPYQGAAAVPGGVAAQPILLMQEGGDAGFPAA